MLQKDLASFERPPMTWIDQSKVMPGDIDGIDCLYRKAEAGRVDFVKPIEFIYYTSAKPQINRIIWLIEGNPPWSRLLLRLNIRL